MTTSILLGDDHPVIRLGIKTLLAYEPGWQVVGEAGTGQEVIQMVAQLKPDLVILDLTMPGLSGLEVLGAIQQQSPRSRVLILSMHRSKPFVAAALKSGAIGYVLKESTDKDLAIAVRAAIAGKRFLSEPITEVALNEYYAQVEAGPFDLYETLTAREREVLQLAAEGETSAQIGKRLFISPRTVENHRANLMHKLGLRNQSELIRYAVQRRLLHLEVEPQFSKVTDS